jgi:hypothetical protein
VSTYREIVGKKVKTLSSDPSDGLDGEMWYNSSTGNFRGLAIISAWSSASNLINGQSEMAAGGTQTATIKAFGGTPNSLTCEEYNGSGWTSLPNGNTARRLLAATAQGTPSAFLAIGGYTTTYSNLVEEYNGSSWTANPTINTARYSFAGAGTATSALAFGGDVPGGPRSNASESFNGSSWTATPNLNTARNGIAGCGGSNTSGLAFGGDAGPPGIVTDTEEFDGSSWTAGGALPVAMSTAGSGIQTAALAAGGTPAPNNAKASSYDGTSWTALSDLGTGRDVNRCSGAGNTANVAIGGWPLLKTTEEFNSSTNTITAAAWASGGAMPAAYYGFSGSAGTLTAGIALGGKTPPGDQATILKYDGTSWTANPSNLNTARRSGASVGTQTATLLAGGVTGSTTFKNEAEEFNGSSATAQTALPYSGSSNFGFGTQTAAVIAGGYAPPFPTLASTNVEYDGSSLTASTALPAARGLGGSAGQAQTTGLVWAGLSPSAVDTTLEYDGTNWTSGGTYLESKSNLQGFGDQTSAISGGGEPDVSTCAGYDGTAWSTRPSLPGTRKQAGSGGSANTSGLMFGGETPPITDTTIEFTGETSAANIENFDYS